MQFSLEPILYFFAIEKNELATRESELETSGQFHYYFAIGADADKDTIEKKIGKVHVLGKTTLINYGITFVSTDNTLGKTTAVVYPKQGNLVSGIVYGLSEDQMDKMKIHKMKSGQIPLSLQATDSLHQQEHPVTLFIKDPKTKHVAPRVEYVTRIISLAKQHKFSRLYISYLECIRKGINTNQPLSKL